MGSDPRPSSPRIASTGLPRRTLDTRARIMLPFCALLLLGLAVHRLVIADPEWPATLKSPVARWGPRIRSRSRRRTVSDF